VRAAPAGAARAAHQRLAGANRSAVNGLAGNGAALGHAGPRLLRRTGRFCLLLQTGHQVGPGRHYRPGGRLADYRTGRPLLPGGTLAGSRWPLLLPLHGRPLKAGGRRPARSSGDGTAAFESRTAG